MHPNLSWNSWAWCHLCEVKSFLSPYVFLVLTGMWSYLACFCRVGLKHETEGGKLYISTNFLIIFIQFIKAYLSSGNQDMFVEQLLLCQQKFWTVLRWFFLAWPVPFSPCLLITWQVVLTSKTRHWVTKQKKRDR